MSSTTGAIVAAATKIQPTTVTKPVPAARHASTMPQGPPSLSAAATWLSLTSSETVANATWSIR